LIVIQQQCTNCFSFAEKARDGNKAEDLFAILSSCLEIFFDTEKLGLPSPGAEALQPIQHPLENIKSHFKLLQVISGRSEEVVCGAHIALHKRAPYSIELLFCNPQTTDVDVEDFLDRWALFPQTSQAGTSGKRGLSSTKVTFWLVNVEHLAYPTQTRCMQKLHQIGNHLALNAPKLFLVTRAVYCSSNRARSASLATT